MGDDIDIWRAAKVLVDLHGADAPVHAAMRIDSLSADGDTTGSAVWRRVLAGMREHLLRPESVDEFVREYHAEAAVKGGQGPQARFGSQGTTRCDVQDRPDHRGHLWSDPASDRSIAKAAADSILGANGK